MPGENNPWSGELKARRKKSRTADLSSKEGTQNPHQQTKNLEHKNEVKSRNTTQPSADFLHASPKNIDTNEALTNHKNMATTGTDTTTNILGEHSNKTETNKIELTKSNPDYHDLNKNLKKKQKMKKTKEAVETCDKQENTIILTQKEEPRQEVAEEDEEILKITRRNLRPVLQPFKRSGSIKDDVQTETPVDRLIRQGSLEPTSEQSNTKRVSPIKAMPNTPQKKGNVMNLILLLDINLSACAPREREEEKLRKESEEYLMVNFPAGVRKNLKGILLPDKKSKRENESEESINNDHVENDDDIGCQDEGKSSLGRAMCDLIVKTSLLC